MRLNAMRKRSVAAVAALTVLIGLLTATPALASYSRAILFPERGDHVLLALLGPRDHRVTSTTSTTNGPNDPNRDVQRFDCDTRTARRSTPRTSRITPASRVSHPKTVQFSWPPLNVTSNTKYEVAVYRGTHPAEGAALHPQAAARQDHVDRPRSVLPHGQRRLQGHDEDHLPALGELQPDQGTGSMRRPAAGVAAAALVREVTQFVNRVAGTYAYIWNGRNDGGVVLPEGDYWVQHHRDRLHRDPRERPSPPRVARPVLPSQWNCHQERHRLSPQGFHRGAPERWDLCS